MDPAVIGSQWAGYTKTNLRTGVENAAPAFGMQAGIEARFGRRPLGGKTLGLSLIKLAPGGGVAVPLARTHSVALIGVTGEVVEVEADIANGLVGTILVGLPDTALREARDRIRAAIVNSGEEWPQRKITVGLSPASLPKRGSWFDLATFQM